MHDWLSVSSELARDLARVLERVWTRWALNPAEACGFSLRSDAEWHAEHMERESSPFRNEEPARDWRCCVGSWQVVQVILPASRGR